MNSYLVKKDKIPEDQKYNLHTPIALWALDVRFKYAENQLQKAK